MRARELAEVVRGLDVKALERQVGPFALMQRPPPDSRAEQAKVAGVRTTLNPALKLKHPPSSVDFGDLLIAVLPPPASDGSLKLSIGRSPDCDLVIEDAQVSKRHAAIQWNGSAALIYDLDSANGTFVNGRRIKQGWTLRDSDQLTFGRSHFIYLVPASLHRRIGNLR